MLTARTIIPDWLTSFATCHSLCKVVCIPAPERPIDTIQIAKIDIRLGNLSNAVRAAWLWACASLVLQT